MNAIYASLMLATTTVQNQTVDDNSYGPGFLGFVFTAVLALAVILLGRDMVRRVRRVRYTNEAQMKQADLVTRGENQPLEESTEPIDPKTSEEK